MFYMPEKVTSLPHMLLNQHILLSCVLLVQITPYGVVTKLH